MIARMTIVCLLVLNIGCSKEKKVDTPARVKPAFGRFDGKVSAVWDDGGRNMTLNDDFAYVDAKEKRWLAPASSVVNGASIPKAFWSITGGPFEGSYRNASVVHDVACVEMNESWQDVHRMFYDACRCGGVGAKKANLMYFAVYRFGPRWKEVKEVRTTMMMVDGNEVPKRIEISRNVRADPLPPDDADIVQKAIAYFEENDPSLAEIEKLEF